MEITGQFTLIKVMLLMERVQQSSSWSLHKTVHYILLYASESDFISANHFG